MLPFLKLNKESAAPASEDFDPHESIAEELCKAIDKKDYKAIAEALRASHELLDLEPHEEASHEGEK